MKLHLDGNFMEGGESLLHVEGYHPQLEVVAHGNRTKNITGSMFRFDLSEVRRELQIPSSIDDQRLTLALNTARQPERGGSRITRIAAILNLGDAGVRLAERIAAFIDRI